jgi:hypothetical protein
MRYILDSNSYVTAISFGTTMEYNDCVCVEYTGMVPSGWSSLEDWYFDEGDKLWRWQILGGDLVMNATATAPAEGSWVAPSVECRELDYTEKKFETLEITDLQGEPQLVVLVAHNLYSGNTQNRVRELTFYKVESTWKCVAFMETTVYGESYFAITADESSFTATYQGSTAKYFNGLYKMYIAY